MICIKTSVPMERMMTASMPASSASRLRPSWRGGSGSLIKSPSLLLEHHHAERGQVQQHGLLVTVVGDGVGFDAAVVALVGAAIDRRVAVEHFAPMAGLGHSHAIAAARDGSEVAGYNQRSVLVLAIAQVGEHAVVVVVGVDPAPYCGVKI